MNKAHPWFWLDLPAEGCRIGLHLALIRRRLFPESRDVIDEISRQQEEQVK